MRALHISSRQDGLTKTIQTIIVAAPTVHTTERVTTHREKTLALRRIQIARSEASGNSQVPIRSKYRPPNSEVNRYHASSVVQRIRRFVRIHAHALISVLVSLKHKDRVRKKYRVSNLQSFKLYRDTASPL